MAEGDIVQKWKDDNIVDLWTFRYLLYNQMIKYNSTHHKYSGDTTMRPATQHKRDTGENIKYYARGKNREDVIRGGSIVQL